MLRKVMSQILPLELCRKVVSVMLSSSSSSPSSSSSSSSSSASLDCESLMTSATNSSFHLPELEKLYFNFSELEKVCFYFSELEKLYFFSELEKLCFYFSGKLSSIYNFELPWQLHTLSDLLTKRQKDKKVKRQKDKRLKDKKDQKKKKQHNFPNFEKEDHIFAIQTNKSTVYFLSDK